MGMFDGMYDTDPSNPNDQTESYKKPGGDPFAEFGIMTPMQKQMQAIAFQNMQQQQQMARQQQMLQMQQMQQNMGSSAAGVMSGLAGPAMMQMGGAQPAFVKPLTNAINQFLPGGGLNNGNGLGNPGPQGGGGMTPPGQNIMQGLDYRRIVNAAVAANPKDLGAAYRQAADQIDQVGAAKGDPDAESISARLRISARQEELSSSSKQSVIDKNTADTNRANVEAAKTHADMTKPIDGGVVNMPNGDTARVFSAYDPTKDVWDSKAMFRGQALQRTMDTTPAQKGKEVEDFQALSTAVVGTTQKIDQVKTALQQGAATGTWTQNGVNLINNVAGVIGQIAPGAKLDDDATRALNDLKSNGTFSKWADISATNDSVIQDLTMSLASTYATGGRISNQDIKRASEIIGEHIESPRTFAAVLDSVKKRATDNYETTYGAYKSRLTDANEIQSMDKLHDFTNSKINPHPADVSDALTRY